jgi:hypothetical protein
MMRAGTPSTDPEWLSPGNNHELTEEILAG